MARYALTLGYSLQRFQRFLSATRQSSARVSAFSHALDYAKIAKKNPERFRTVAQGQRLARQSKTVASDTPKALKIIAQGQRRPVGASATLGKGARKGVYPEGVEDYVVSVFWTNS